MATPELVTSSLSYDEQLAQELLTPCITRLRLLDIIKDLVK